MKQESPQLGPRPCFFASVSSVKTNVDPVDAVELLRTVGASHFLVSAFDVSRAGAEERQRIVDSVTEARRRGARVLLDSGNYERYWHRDETWTRDRYHEVLQSVTCDLAFTFDVPRDGGLEEVVEHIVAGARVDISASSKNVIAPIVHVPGGRCDMAPAMIREVAVALHAPVVAIPERELGDGILARAAMVRAIRRELLRSELEVTLHLLGTGNPWSLVLYAAAGADTFDGLEWCQTIADRQTGLLFHFQQYDFFRGQTTFGDGALPFDVAAMAHNIAFFEAWLAEIRLAIAAGDVPAFVARLAPPGIRQPLLDAIEELGLGVNSPEKSQCEAERH
jgi:queuine/archaeosine tRNA-ribosyltransferase